MESWTSHIKKTLERLVLTHVGPLCILPMGRCHLSAAACPLSPGRWWRLLESWVQFHAAFFTDREAGWVSVRLLSRGCQLSLRQALVCASREDLIWCPPPTGDILISLPVHLKTFSKTQSHTTYRSILMTRWWLGVLKMDKEYRGLVSQAPSKPEHGQEQWWLISEGQKHNQGHQHLG